MTTQLRDGSAVEDPRFGRIEYRPESNLPYNVSALREEQKRGAAAVRRSRGHSVGPGMDQGQEGECVLYGTTHRRNSTPKQLRPLHLDQMKMRADYHAVQHLDPWDGCSLGPRCPIAPSRQSYGGTSVHTAMDYGKKNGWWSSYWWVGAGSGDVLGDIVHANATVGGIVYGLNWYKSMFRPRPSGLLEVDLTSGLAGGHCVYAPAVRLSMRLPREWKGTKEVVVIQQSWGEDYGVADLGRPGGMVFMLLEDLGTLMAQRGEGAVIVR